MFKEYLEQSRIAYVEGSGEGDVEIEISKIVRKTDQAVLLCIMGEDVWVPLSVLGYASILEKVATVAEWFAEKEGL